MNSRKHINKDIEGNQQDCILMLQHYFTFCLKNFGLIIS